MSVDSPTSRIRQDFSQLGTDAAQYFEDAESGMGKVEIGNLDLDRDVFWAALPDRLRVRAKKLVEQLVAISGRLAPMLKLSPLASEADQRELMTATKTMRAALYLKQFEHRDIEVLHDDGIVLGVRPALQSDDKPLSPYGAGRSFTQSAARYREVLQLVEASEELSPANLEQTAQMAASRYRPGTAFIMMWMDKKNPELDDVCDTVKQMFSSFGIRAIRADDIQHGDLITARIIDEIATAEFLFADLTGARPSVYYEVGYAHALGRRVMLYRKAGTGIHFDLAGYNCPEYQNLRELKDMLGKRLVQVTGRNPKPEGSETQA
jgi:hypothetical protein